MKVIKCLFLCLILAFTYSCNLNEKEPDHIRIANKVLSKISKEIQKKYNVKQVGAGGEMLQCVRNIGLAFQLSKVVTQDEARALIVPMSELFLQRINENEEIRPYLQKYPFSVDNISVSIFLSDNGKDVYDPYIDIVGCSHGNIYYLTFKPDNLYTPHNKYEETFEEAVEKLKQQSNHDKI